jgi:putative FmdB family regulatory protein
MPTYEYLCKNCGETIEVFQSFSDKPLKKHKECGGALQKVFHARGIVFKGGGFYATDSKTSSSSKGASDGGSEPKPAKESKAKTEKAATPAASPSSSTSSRPSSDD